MKKKKMKEEIQKLSNRVERLEYESRFYNSSSFYRTVSDMPSVEVKNVIEMILSHLDLELTSEPARSEKFSLTPVEEAPVTPKNATESNE